MSFVTETVSNVRTCSYIQCVFLCVFHFQFEYMSQHLVFANCIPLILKYLNQNISAFVAAKNT